MSKQKGFITEKINLMKKLSFMTVFAEEPSNGEPTTPPVAPEVPKAPVVNYEDLIASARKQEKDKLYPQIKKLEDEKAVLTEKSNAHLLLIGEKDAEISRLKQELEKVTLASSKGANDKEKTLLSEIETLKGTIADLESNTVTREEIEAEIRGEYEIKLYREQKLREVGENVIPELITGVTKEEIDASIQKSQERFQQIQSRVLGNVNVPVANANVSGFQAKDLKVEDIANLDPRSPEYAQLRAKLGLR